MVAGKAGVPMWHLEQGPAPFTAECGLWAGVGDLMSTSRGLSPLCTEPHPSLGRGSPPTEHAPFPDLRGGPDPGTWACYHITTP